MLLGWMIFIFVMSNTPGNESSNQSEFVIYLFSRLGIDLNSTFGEMATLIVRKGAHFTEYAILYILLCRVSAMYNRIKHEKIFLIAMVFLYASSDEFHQYFIPERAARFADVMIDTSGGIFAFIITKVIGVINNYRRVRKED
jgi:VanZ family protein